MRLSSTARSCDGFPRFCATDRPGLSLAGLHPVVTGSVALLPLLAGASFSAAGTLLPFAISTDVPDVLPTVAFGSASLFDRLGIFLVPLWLDAVERAAGWIATPGVGCHGGRGDVGFANRIASPDWRVSRRVLRETLASMNGTQVAAIIQKNSSPYFFVPVYLHFRPGIRLRAAASSQSILPTSSADGALQGAQRTEVG